MCSDKSSTNQRADHDVVSRRGRTIFVADAHRGDGKRFVVRADEKLEYDESAEFEETDRLLLSALRYWEVQRDLIEERIVAIRSVSVPS
jgi:hypothetical protein